MLYIDIHIFLACRRACPSTECPPRSFVCEQYWLGYEFCLHIYPRLSKTLSFNVPFFFNSFLFILKRWCTPVFLFSCLVPVWIRNDLIGGLVGLFHHFSFFFCCWFWILISTTAMNSRGCGLSVNALCCFRHISSSHGSELTWCCTMLPRTLFFPPNDIFSLVLIPLPPSPAACIYCIHWPNMNSLNASIIFFFVCLGFLLCLYVIEMSQQLGSAC